VSNSRLCKAALDRNLDKFILTKIFTGRQWRPMYVETLLEERGDKTRKIPCKTVADVVESLIGAGWRMGQHQTALSITKLFLPEVDLPSLEVGRSRLFDIAPADMPLPADLNSLESLVGYSFKKKSLLVKSMSHHSDLNAIASYERLEFLGDAILEIIIVTELMAYEGILSHSLMHLYKTTLVNGDYLSFLALEWKIAQRKSDVKEDSRSGTFKEVESLFYLPLWRFMRHGLSSIGETQREVERRHALLRCEILQDFESGREYPWALLARIHANKFYSDLIESLLGAVWVDSGSLEVCKQVLDRMGMLKLMHRLVTNRVHALHPREELCILAGDQEVKYVVQKNESAGGEWICTVCVGNSQIIEVLDGVSEEEARTRAAGGAVALLRSSNGRTGAPTPYL
jgi:dsRNA-specific ribonuclease